jgi:hypothetical protein
LGRELLILVNAFTVFIGACLISERFCKSQTLPLASGGENRRRQTATGQCESGQQTPHKHPPTVVSVKHQSLL